jgi:hypothetical protein
MSLAWQIVKNDIRHLRWWLGVSVVLLLTELLLGIWILHSTEAVLERFDLGFSLSLALLTGVQVLVNYLLVGRLMLDSSVSNDSLGASVSRLHALAAKLPRLGLLAWLVPVMITFPWWLDCGYGVRELALAALITFRGQFLISCCAIPAVVLSRNFVRFCLWSLLILILALAI